MEISSRILNLRKEMRLNQSDFGKRIGVTSSAICNYENGSRSVGEQVILAICREFNVSEEWLRTGEGEMFQQDNGSILKRVAQEYRLSDREQAVVASFLELSSADRAAIMRYVDSLVKKLKPLTLPPT